MTATDPAIDLRAAARAAQARVAHSDVVVPRDRRRDISRPPGPRPLATLRGLTSVSAPEFLASIERDYQPMAHTRLGREHAYILTAPSAIVDVFIGHGRQTMKGRGLQGAKAILGNGLLTSEGDVHLRNRRLVQPAFHRDRIAGYSQDMVRLAQIHANGWREGAEVDMQADMSALTLAIVGTTLFGADLTGEAREIGESLEDLLHGMGSRLFLGPAALRIPTPARQRGLEAISRIDLIVQRMIDDHRAAGDTGDMLSMLIAAEEEGDVFDDAQVRDEAMTLVLAGHETTAMTLTWTWLLMSRNPAAAEWLHEELDDVLAGRTPTMTDMASLPRTRAIVAEAIRLYPPAWIQGRRLLDDIEVDGWTMPAGALVLASQYALHRSPRWWTSAQSFRPQRWLTDDGTFSEDAPGQPRGAWFPFGWGNRRCIGEQFAWTESTLVLATLAQQWRPEFVPGTVVTPRPAVTLRARNGVPMRLVRR